MSQYPYWHELSAILMFMFTFIIINLSVTEVKKYIRRENAKLFKAVVYMQYLGRPFTVFEVREIYKEECKKHGFDEI